MYVLPLQSRWRASRYTLCGGGGAHIYTHTHTHMHMWTHMHGHAMLTVLLCRLCCLEDVAGLDQVRRLAGGVLSDCSPTHFVGSVS